MIKYKRIKSIEIKKGNKKRGRLVNTVIKQLRKKLIQFEKESERKSEDDLSNQIILWLLEDCLGYERSSMHWEKRLPSKNRNRFADIVIDIQEGEKLIVETKKYDSQKDLDEEDIQQLIDYLSRENSLWGILTNGREILLINMRASANINVMEKIVLRINVAVGKQRGKNEKYISYLSKEKIFDSRVTNYYRDIAYFFSLHKLSKSSRERYENTLYNFFDDYAEINKIYIEYAGGKHQSLEEISEKDVIEFLKRDRPFGRPYSGQIPKAKCAHIGAMFKDLCDSGYIKENRMSRLLERATVLFASEENSNDIAEKVLSLQEMKVILSGLEEQNKPSKVIIFILCGYYGFDRALIVKFFSLPWTCVDYEHCYFELEGKKYPMVEKLAKWLKEKQREYKEKGVKPTAINVIRKGEKYFPAKKDTVNALFDEDIKIMDKNNERINTLTPQKMRAIVIYNMCKCGCTLDEVSYLTNATVSQILRYVPEDVIEKNGMKIWRSGKKDGRRHHPYKEIFGI